jgi:hypothetical protein
MIWGVALSMVCQCVSEKVALLLHYAFGRVDSSDPRLPLVW